MSKNSELDGPAPDKIFVVVCGGKYRIYVREGQAVNRLSQKIKDGHPLAEIITFIPESK